MSANCIGLQKHLKLNNYYFQVQRQGNILACAIFWIPVMVMYTHFRSQMHNGA
jgi:hypothetical protein